jgi:uracil-DNA glycosylase
VDGCGRRDLDYARRMAAPLSDTMRTLLDGWRADLAPAWSQALAGVEPDFGAVRADLDVADGEVVFPGRKGRPPAGARPDAHVFRALDGIAPADVRVVVMGQDPYTRVEQATGRSFEQGDLADWLGKPKVTPSLRRIVQALARRRTGNLAYLDGQGGWGRVVADIKSGALPIEGPRALWDHWQAQGVVFLNAILTFNRFQPDHQFRGHQPLWRPILVRLLDALVRRPEGALVCVAWGGKAADAFKGARVEESARAAGTWESRVRVVTASHPNAFGAPPPFFAGSGDPLRDVNDALVAMGGKAVEW